MFGELLGMGQQRGILATDPRPTDARRGQRTRCAVDEAAAAELHTALGNHLGVVAPD